MSRYLKLVHFEFQRFAKLYLVLIGMTIVLQLTGIIVVSRKYMSDANQLIYKELMPKSQFIEQFGEMSFNKLFQSLWFVGPIMLCIAVLIIYVFFIWYRDWLGKNTFVYRLLMLPTARSNVYLAKATTIFLLVFGLVALQIVLYPVESQVLQWVVPDEFRMDLSLNEIAKLSYLYVLFPDSFIEFVLHYGIGMIAVFVVFTAILFERAYRFIGIFYGVVYSGVSFLIFIAPLLIDGFLLNGYFYPIEIFLLMIVSGLIVLAGAILLGNYLINHKVRV